MPTTTTMPTRAEVLRRLESEAVTTHRMFSEAEAEIRESRSGGTVVVTGYASVFETQYPMHGGPERGGWAERIERGAFTKTLQTNPDVHLLINHKDLPLARTRSGTLKLAQDQRGLHVESELDLRSERVKELRIAMERGDVSEMSFGFRPTRDTWLDQRGDKVPAFHAAGIDRRIGEVSVHRGDVSIVNFGANPSTVAGLTLRGMDDTLETLHLGRALTRAQRQRLEWLLGLEQRSYDGDEDGEDEDEDMGDEDDLAPVIPGSGAHIPPPTRRAVSLAAARAAF